MKNIKPKTSGGYVENKILVFAGTYEGRKLCETLSTCFSNITVCVATEYGKDLLAGIKHISVISKRLDAAEMVELLTTNKYELVIDATHPYAKEVTVNIKSACDETQTNYQRLLRDESHHTDVITATDTKAAADFLETTSGNILLTTGSKELGKFCNLTQYKERLYVRVLPSSKVLAECEELGFSGKHIVAMQGPFSHELNVAVLQQFNCSYIVTKNTGIAGGVDEKISSALQVGAKVVLIDRPTEQTSCHSFGELLTLVNQQFKVNLCDTTKQRCEFFPLFIPSNGKKALVIGAGNIGLRRIKTLLRFTFEITVIAPDVSDEIGEFAKNGLITLLKRDVSTADVNGFDLVVVATNCRNVNYMMGEAAKTAGIKVSVADVKEECSFYFPAIVVKDELIVGITSGGQSHTAVRQAAQRIKEIIT